MNFIIIEKLSLLSHLSLSLSLIPSKVTRQSSFLTVKLTTFTAICILTFDSSINSLNSKFRAEEKTQAARKKKKNPKIKPNQTKNQNLKGENEDEQGEG
jgi:hypothetical protein